MLNWATLIVMESTFAMLLVRCMQNVLRSKTNTWRKPKGQSRTDNQEWTIKFQIAVFFKWNDMIFSYEDLE
jgi:hypothetical protein